MTGTTIIIFFLSTFIGSSGAYLINEAYCAWNTNIPEVFIQSTMFQFIEYLGVYLITLFLFVLIHLITSVALFRRRKIGKAVFLMALLIPFVTGLIPLLVYP